uniref:Uncharacterized protein n=1 Tax=Arundo donax TaxID=35708 RepID=A0A0A9CDJ8_ARUDO
MQMIPLTTLRFFSSSLGPNAQAIKGEEEDDDSVEACSNKSCSRPYPTGPDFRSHHSWPLIHAVTPQSC